MRGSGDEEKLGIRKSRKGRWSIGGKVGGGLGDKVHETKESVRGFVFRSIL